MSTTFARNISPRRGQALLLAVLVMLLAALLSATMLAVVSGNLNQTARTIDKDQARLNARAGLEFADARLVGSIEGDKWRPATENVPPAPGDADYNFYYSATDRVHGWARTLPRAALDDEQSGEWDGVAPAETLDDDRAKVAFFQANRDERVWAKYPDPRQPSTADAPAFLLEIHRITTGAKRGILQISAVGLAPNDPVAFHRELAFKNGPAQTPLTAATRSVSNWNFARRAVPASQVESVAGAALTLRQGVSFPTDIGAFYVSIGTPNSPGGVRGAVIAQAAEFDAATQTQTLTFAYAPVPAPAPGERVEMAAALGAPTRIDYDLDGALTSDIEEARFAPAADATPGGVWVNGGLLWFGNVNLKLRAPADTTDETGASVRVSGLISQDGSDPATNPSAIGADLAFQNGSDTETLPAQTLLPSDNANFPFDAPTISGLEKERLVSDGWGQMSGNPIAPGRGVNAWRPPDVFGVAGLGRYRELTRSSPSAPGQPPSAASFGGGEGIYLDNGDDRERVGTGAGTFREMTQPEMVAMWLGSGGAATAITQRNGVPALASDADKSLEEQHLRGWIGPDEFRARGALIELIADDPGTPAPDDAAVSITLDARADGSTPDPNFPADAPDNQGPVRRKSWRDPATGALLPGVYTRVFPWPRNGVIFGEGNLRVRGQAPNAPRSLTVVSRGNIFIEGSLQAGSRKVLLIAQHNVVLNPTSVIARLEAQTVLEAAPVGNALAVADAAAFLPGDWIAIDGAAPPLRVVTVAANSLILSEPPPPGALAGAAVRAVSDPLDAGRARTDFGRLGGFDDVLQRRFVRPPSASSAPLRLALRHSAERVTAWTLGADEASPPANPNPLMAIKKAPPAGGAGPKTTIVRPADKVLDVFYTDAGGLAGRDVFPLPPGPLTQTDATAFGIGDLRAVMLDSVTGRPAPSGPPPYAWYYTSPPLAPAMTDLPFFLLVGVGNRYPDYDALASGGPLRRNLITGDYEIPLATSVEIALDGARSELRSDRWNTDLDDFERVRQFGFNPTYGAGLTPDDPAAWEDVLSGDQTFYTTARHTLDSRVLAATGAGTHGLALRFSAQSGLPGDAPLRSYFAADASLPAYRAARLKWEEVGLNADHQIETLVPGATLDVNAYVYAQQGSWLVIPGAAFDETVKGVAGVRGTYVETNDPPDGPTPGEFVDAAPAGFSDGDYADLDHDGVISRAEQVAPFRYGRANYQINFVGAIMEHHSALVRDPDSIGPLTGAVADWMDAWSTVTLDADNWDGPGAGDAFLHDLSAQNGDFGGISYRFDAAAARGFFDQNGNDSPDAGESVDEDLGFRPPVVPGLIYN